MFCVLAFAQGKQITGVIKDGTGEPMIGVNVLVKGTTNGTITDFDGKFAISDVKNSDVLTITYCRLCSAVYSRRKSNYV